MKVYQKPGLKLRDPVTRRVLSESGEEKPENNFWRQRVAHGDVTLEPPVSEAQPESITIDNEAFNQPAPAPAEGEHDA